MLGNFLAKNKYPKVKDGITKTVENDRFMSGMVDKISNGDFDKVKEYLSEPGGPKWKIYLLLIGHIINGFEEYGEYYQANQEVLGVLKRYDFNEEERYWLMLLYGGMCRDNGDYYLHKRICELLDFSEEDLVDRDRMIETWPKDYLGILAFYWKKDKKLKFLVKS